MAEVIPIEAGRKVFGRDGETYAAARPDYPPRIYEILRNSGAVRSGTNAFEVGPGTGLVTGPLLEMGCRVTAIEPDQQLASILKKRLDKYSEALTIERQTFEEIRLPPQSFDLGVAATSLHWLRADTALAKSFHLLRPGGHWAMWWTVFGDPADPDDFQIRTQTLFKSLPQSPSHELQSGRPLALDKDRWLAEFIGAGFVKPSYEEIRWQPILSASQLQKLTATFSPVACLPEGERIRFLQEIGRIADEEFNGGVRRNFVTAIYTSRKPGKNTPE